VGVIQVLVANMAKHSCYGVILIFIGIDSSWLADRQFGHLHWLAIYTFEYLFDIHGQGMFSILKMDLRMIFRIRSILWSARSHKAPEAHIQAVIRVVWRCKAPAALILVDAPSE